MNRSRKGTTLIEVLVAIAIIAILSAIVLSGFQAAKASSKGTVSINQMRQLAAAGALYSQDYGQFPDSTHRLVDSKLIKPDICSAPSDPTERGIANNMKLPTLYEGAKTEYRNTYAGWLQLVVSPIQVEELLEPNGDGGWLVDLSPTQNPLRTNLPFAWVGQYRRLQLDGAVVMRHMSKFPAVNPEGKEEMAIIPVMFFMDDFERYKAWGKSRGHQD